MQDDAGVARLRARAQALLTPTESGFEQLIKFGVAGAVATIADTGLLMGLAYFAPDLYVIWAAIGYAAGLIISYVFSVLWIFPHRNITDRRLEFIVFVAIGLVALGLTEIVLIINVEIFRLSLLVAKLVSVVIVFFFNFGARKAVMFAGPRK